MGAVTTRVENFLDGPESATEAQIPQTEAEMVFCGRLKMDISGEMG